MALVQMNFESRYLINYQEMWFFLGVMRRNKSPAEF